MTKGLRALIGQAPKASLIGLTGLGLSPAPAFAGACSRLAECAQNDPGATRLLLFSTACIVAVICCMAGDRQGRE